MGLRMVMSSDLLFKTSKAGDALILNRMAGAQAERQGELRVS